MINENDDDNEDCLRTETVAFPFGQRTSFDRRLLTVDHDSEDLSLSDFYRSAASLTATSWLSPQRSCFNRCNATLTEAKLL